jgi:hypothetical protein
MKLANWRCDSLEETMTILSCSSKDADTLVDLLLKVKKGDLAINDVTKAAGNLVEIRFERRS